MQKNILEGYERSFRRAKLLFYLGIGSIFELNVLFFLYWRELKPVIIHPFAGNNIFFKVHPWIGLLMFIFSYAGTFMAHVGFSILNDLYTKFLKESGIHPAAVALANASNWGLRRPRFRYFVVQRSLAEFEQKEIRLYNELRKDALKEKHREQELRNIELTRQKSEELQQQFAAVLPVVTTESELNHYRKRFSASRNLEEARSIIRELETKSEREHANRVNQIAKRDRLREMLAELTMDGICPEAADLLRDSEQTPYVKESADFLKKAVTAQKKFNKRQDTVRESTAAPRAADHRFADSGPSALTDLFPIDIDREMAVQILMSLAEENPDGHGSLRLRTASSYRTAFRKSFPARSFDETLGWLLQQRIVFAAAERNERSYSLNPKADAARRMIAFETGMTKSERE